MIDSPHAVRHQPESFRASALTVSLTVNDLARSVAWYRDAMGFTIEREYERGGALRAVAMKAGAVQILLGQDDGAKGADRVKGAGFSLRFITSQSIDDIARRITSRGGVLETSPADMPGGVRAFRVKDPDGVMLVISSAP